MSLETTRYECAYCGQKFRWHEYKVFHEQECERKQ